MAFSKICNVISHWFDLDNAWKKKNPTVYSMVGPLTNFDTFNTVTQFFKIAFGTL